MALTQNGIIAVDGATGYVGNHLVSELRKNNFAVRAIVRPEARLEDIKFLEQTGADIYPALIKRDSTKLLEALTGVSCIVHLIGSIAPKKGEKLEDLHGGQTTELLAAASKAGVPKIVLLTALGSKAEAASKYHQTKAQSESIVSRSGLTFVILQPSLIIGKLVGNRDSKLVARYRKMIQEKSAVPLINGGANKLQPVFVGDLAKALTKAATTNVADGTTVEIGGDEVLTMKSFVSMLMSSTGTTKPIKAIPAGLVSLAAGALELFQPVPLVSRDQVTLACQDNICSHNGLQSVFGISPLSVSEALQTYNASREAGAQSQSASRL